MDTVSSTAITQLASHLRVLTESLDPGAGWYGEFLRRDPEGMRACLDGIAIPPWDVVESLLQDLAGLRGAEFAAERSGHAARLRQAAVLAYDRMPGGEEELHALLAAAGAQREASEAAVYALTARLSAAGPADAAALARELSWTQDDLTRATSRCADLAARLDALAPQLPALPRQRPPTGPPDPLWPPADSADFAVSDPEPPAWAPSGADPEPPAGPGVPWLPGDAAQEGAVPDPGPRLVAGARKVRRSGGARFAGAAPEDGGTAAFAAPPGMTGTPDPAVPRGARFGRPAAPGPSWADHPAEPGAGTPATGTGAVGTEPAPGAVGPAPGDGRSGPGEGAPVLVGELIGLRGQGRTGEAHALLCEAAWWDAALLPGLGRELERAGLAADWAALLWEAASLPPDRLAALAAALEDSGRPGDCDRLLRQGAARPAPEIADAALALGAAGRAREADSLLEAFVRVRTAEEAARLARRDPGWFAPRLLRAARGVSGSAHRDLVHAFRVAGIATTA
ncbi:hypothetical protein OHS33_29625 [Streptomyces sp. NBC_00536]|uniref:hypothetical protein n=1 Tax=Streptomyces sp. NBC_00536 TaxID=2975769 RepID=UPI002E81253B|nr:hypothetical protein [Streptomyces sp. NBC_00536]WUC82147.1 hypothetical protein OHS33_29625 [Streptomyces sp. NBC_00536]